MGINMIEIPSNVVAVWPASNYANCETKGPALSAIVVHFSVFVDRAMLLLTMVNPNYMLLIYFNCLLTH